MSDDDAIREMIDYYARRAPVYDESMGYLRTDHAEVYAEQRDYFQEKLKGLDVLEIACGPGYWTEALAGVVRSIVATDVNEETLAFARQRGLPEGKVRFQQADAYTLEGVEGTFTGACANLWWSHIPKDRIPIFLTALNAKIEPGAVVVFSDNSSARRAPPEPGPDGNLISRRELDGHGRFSVVKNLPSEAELRRAVADFAQDVEYIEIENYWILSYRAVRAG